MQRIYEPIQKDSIPNQWRAFSSHTVHTVTFDRGEYLYREGHSVEEMYFILSGTVKVCINNADGNALLISFCKAGELLGEAETVLRSDAFTSVQAVHKTVCYCVPSAVFYDMMHKDINLSNKVCQLLAERSRLSVHNTSTNVLSDLEPRLCAYICETKRPNNLFKDNLRAVSQLLGTSYRHLHRTLHKLCDEHILQRQNRCFLIENPAEIEKRAGGIYRY